MSKKEMAMEVSMLKDDEDEDRSEGRLEVGAPVASPLTFPLRLLRILEMDDRTKGIYWLEGGKQFAIHTEDVLPTLVNDFQGAKWLSFTRTLNKWGFKKVTGGKLPPKTVAYFCTHFQRDNPHLIRNMTNQSKASNRKRKASWELQTAQPSETAPACGQVPTESTTNELAAARASLGPGIGGATMGSFTVPSPRLEAHLSSLAAAQLPRGIGQISSATSRPGLQGSSLGHGLPLGSDPLSSYQSVWNRANRQTDALLQHNLAASLGIGTAASRHQQPLPNLPLDAATAALALRNSQFSQLSASGTPARQLSQIDAALATAREQQQLRFMARAGQFGASIAQDPPDDNEEEGKR